MLDLSTKMRKSVPLIWYFSFKAIEFASRMCYERLNNGAYHTSWMFSFCTGIGYNVEELREQILVENLHDSTLFLSVQVSKILSSKDTSSFFLEYSRNSKQTELTNLPFCKMKIVIITKPVAIWQFTTVTVYNGD